MSPNKLPMFVSGVPQSRKAASIMQNQSHGIIQNASPEGPVGGALLRAQANPARAKPAEGGAAPIYDQATVKQDAGVSRWYECL